MLRRIRDGALRSARHDEPPKQAIPTTSASNRDLTRETQVLTRALKRPTLSEAVPRLPTQPRLSPGPTRSSLPPACEVRSPPGDPTAAKDGSAPPSSPPASP